MPPTATWLNPDEPVTEAPPKAQSDRLLVLHALRELVPMYRLQGDMAARAAGVIYTHDAKGRVSEEDDAASDAVMPMPLLFRAHTLERHDQIRLDIWTLPTRDYIRGSAVPEMPEDVQIYFGNEEILKRELHLAFAKLARDWESWARAILNDRPSSWSYTKDEALLFDANKIAAESENEFIRYSSQQGGPNRVKGQDVIQPRQNRKNRTLNDLIDEHSRFD